ncbi:MAG: aspartate-semialdehyde dehydrogenase [Proteobacteria bacterium]|nr:aspartate-semialdehyde dehydrogenase [Pseudomonadota bacterium]
MASAVSSHPPLSVALVGATGLVGETILEVLAERDFPVSRLLPLASRRSSGRTLRFRGEELAVREAEPAAFEGVDLVFFAATGSLSKELAPEAVTRGAVVIDKSNTWRMDERVPLVIPEINPAALEEHEGIIACPNCTTIGVAMALEPLRRAAGLRRVVVTTLQATSGAGREASEELEAQLAALARNEEPVATVFPSPIAHNVLPLCERFDPDDDGYSTEEMKLLHETRKILGEPDLDVSMTCVRVPVPVGHSASLLVECERALSPEKARSALDAFPGVRVVDDCARNVFPTPRDVAGGDEVLVGRVRRDLTSERLWLWQVIDNLRKGAATNGVQIAETLIERGLL